MFLKSFFKSELDKLGMSFREFSNLRSLTAASMMLALFVVLSLVNIPLSIVNEIRLTFIPLAVVGMLFGPAVGFAVGALGDILGFLVHPTGAYFPGFTLSTALTGMIYGFAFYKRRYTVVSNAVRSFVSTFIICFGIELVVQTYWLHLLYGMPYAATFWARVVKTVIMFCIKLVVVSGLYAVCERVAPKTKMHT